MTLDVKTLFIVLFLGNLVSVVLIFTYYSYNNYDHNLWDRAHYLLAKACQAVAYALLMSRGAMPAIVSVNMGNTLLLFGFYLEAIAMLTFIQERETFREKFIPGITVVCITAFNIIEFINPNSSIRVAVSSLCVLLILVIPNIRLFVSKNSSPFKRWVGIFYLIFLGLLLPRAFYAFVTDMDILTNSPIQTLTFLALVLLLIFSLPSYLLLMKEDADKVIAAMASTDFLTGLSNRRGFLDAAQRSFCRLKIDCKSVNFLFVDIDHFKNINDTYGHSFGDTVLVALGKVIHECVRSADLTCRYGGEEFVIMLPDATKLIAIEVAERIRKAIKEVEFPGYPDFSLRVSVGIAGGVPKRDDKLELFINRADSALYMAKESGRDRIVEYDSASMFPNDKPDVERITVGKQSGE